MSTPLSKMIDEALALPPESRAKLARELVASLEEGSDTDVEAAWDREVEKRVAEIKRGEAQGRPAEQVLAEIRAKYR
jgi:putative addiction module component (TIGR02574 family)